MKACIDKINLMYFIIISIIGISIIIIVTYTVMLC